MLLVPPKRERTPIVPDQQPWTNNPQVLTYARVLRALVTDFSESDAVEASAIAELLDLQPDDVGAAFDALARDELVTALPMSLADTFTSAVALESTGQAKVAEWDAFTSKSAVRSVCRSAFLAWLDSRAGESANGAHEFKGSTHAHFYGTPFEGQLVNETVAELLNLGLIAGSRRAGGLATPRLTADGQAVLEQYAGDVTAWRTGPPSGGNHYNITNAQGFNIATNSPGTQQNAQAVSAARDAVESVADSLDSMLSRRPDDLDLEPLDLARAFALVPQLREAANAIDEDPAGARRRLRTLVEILKTGSGSALGVGLVALAEQALGFL